MSLQASRTSQVVALIRAELERPHSPMGDPEAQRRLCVGMRYSSATRLRPNIIARTRFFDEEVLRAISGGVKQVVVCGAGYDDRALRFRSAGVNFFELDHPATQTDKARRLRNMGVDMRGLTLIPADFLHDDSAGLLHAHGHIASRPTLFVCEGLLVYLDRQAVLRLLGGLRSVAAPRSTLAASLALLRAEANPNGVAAAANASRRTGRREPWLTIVPEGAYSELLKEAGWTVDYTCDSPGIREDGKIIRMLLLAAIPTIDSSQSVSRP
jgi:methyltransferase (TIGR00027 family)